MTLSSHFKNTISRIHSAFTDVTPDIVNTDFPEVNFQLASFKSATVAEVRNIIMSSPRISCNLDPLPAVLLKECLDELIRPISDIINASLCSEVFPDDFKCAHGNPVLKKTSLHKDDLNSYRTITNLSLISKVLEEVVANCDLILHLHK